MIGNYRNAGIKMRVFTEDGEQPKSLDAATHSRPIKQEFHSYPGLLAYADELSEIERDAFETNKRWLQEATGTGMNKSDKMIVLHYMLSRGQDNWFDPVTPEQIAPYFHQYLTEKDYRINTDFSDKQGQELRT